MYASITATATDPEPNVSARIVDNSAGELQLTLGHRATLFLSPNEAEQIVSALNGALQTAVAHMTTAEVAGAR